MSPDLNRLRRWMIRAKPPRAALARALGAGMLASLTNVALLIGAVVLLVTSATRPELQAVLGPLIVIELFAFLRSPLRFAERMSAHRLGYAAVTRWRRWLVAAIGQLDFSRWRSYAAGDLLERALRDTDELQDLWLRFVIPLSTTAVVMLLGDVVVALLPPRPQWWPYALFLVGAQIMGTTALFTNFGRLVRLDRDLRRARGNYRAQLVELTKVTPELVLLNRGELARSRSLRVTATLRGAERALHRGRRHADGIIMSATLVVLAALALRPHTSAAWIVVASLLALSTADSLNTIRISLDTAVAVSAGAERLEEFDPARAPGRAAWPDDSTLQINDVTIIEDGRPLVAHANLRIDPGRHVALTGTSGSGKSTLLRAIAALDTVHDGTITLGAIPLDDLAEDDLRHHVAYVPSEPGLMRGFVIDVIRLGRTSDRDAHDDLASLGIVTDSTTRWEELSRGESSRVAIVRAVVTNPDILLLDEPTSGLGHSETSALLDFLSCLPRTIVIATHDAQVIEWSDEVVELKDATIQRLSR